MSKELSLSDEEMAMAGRLKKLRNFLKIPQSEVAEGSDTLQSHLSGMELGSKSLQIRVIKYYAEKYRANIEWLLTGDGEMLLNGKNEGTSRREAQHLGLALVDTSGLVAWQQAVEERLTAVEVALGIKTDGEKTEG